MSKFSELHSKLKATTPNLGETPIASLNKLLGQLPDSLRPSITAFVFGGLKNLKEAGFCQERDRSVPSVMLGKSAPRRKIPPAGSKEHEAFLIEICAWLRTQDRPGVKALMRQLRVGYGNAISIFRILEGKGWVSPADEKGNRTILPMLKDASSTTSTSLDSMACETLSSPPPVAALQCHDEPQSLGGNNGNEVFDGGELIDPTCELFVYLRQNHPRFVQSAIEALHRLFDELLAKKGEEHQ